MKNIRNEKKWMIEISIVLNKVEMSTLQKEITRQLLDSLCVASCSKTCAFLPAMRASTFARLEGSVIKTGSSRARPSSVSS
jgi:hypothetical protein